MAKRVLVAHGDAKTLGRLLEDLAQRDEELEVVGPADRAATALALAAIQPVDEALVGPRLAGRRSGADLATALERDWGIPSTMLEE